MCNKYLIEKLINTILMIVIFYKCDDNYIQQVFGQLTISLNQSLI